ncbi:hypothetical protein BDZ97DRAFT_1347777 [Flammula alnicola]|nr:hypothetical protein BDZ97DRAFT_1347777 [Flammula alnicola]
MNSNSTDGYFHEKRIPPLSFPSAEECKPIPQRLTQSQVQKYIYPLLCYGWKLNGRRIGGGDHSRPVDGTLRLMRKMVFKGPNSARRFVKFLLSVEENLNHHTSFSLSDDKRPVLSIVTQTHKQSKSDITQPWLSLRDVSLASQLEQHYSNNYPPIEDDYEALPPFLFDDASWAELLAHYPWDEGVIEDNTFRPF